MGDYSFTVQRSPLHSPRSYYGYGPTPTGITIHWWGRMGQDHDNVADYLCRSGGNTSAHEVISDGRVTHLIDFDRAAWHSGSTEGNGSTIGLECRPEMTAGDLETLAQRCADIENQLGRSMYYYGHSDWYATACPGTWYEQIGWIVSRVNEIHAGKNASPEEDDMPSAKEIVDELLSRDVFEYPWKDDPKNPKWNFRNAIESIWRYAYYGWGDIVPSQESGKNKHWFGRNALGESVQQGRRIERNLATVLKAIEDSANGQPVDVDEQTIVQGILAGLEPQKLAEAIRDGLGEDVAREVVDALGERLNGGKA